MPLTLELRTLLHSAYVGGLREINLVDGKERETLLSCLVDIFEIFSIANWFDSSLIFCAAFVSLQKGCQTADKTKKSGSQINAYFIRMVTNLNPSEFDLVMQELLSTTMEEPCALQALLLALDSVGIGPPLTFV
jgi:hypothetical protein